MKITPADREKILAFYGSQMSVSEITRQLNKGRDKKLQFSRQAVSKILNEFKSCENSEKVAGATFDYKAVAKSTYDKAMAALSNKMDKASVQDLIKTIEYYEKLYHFSEDQTDGDDNEIIIKVVDGSKDD